MHITDYRTAADYLGPKADRPLPGRATRLQRRSETTIAVRYQETDVVTYHAGGTAMLQSDGWQTSTTKERMHTYTPVKLYAERGTWYIGEWYGRDVQPSSLYYDGMTIDAEGKPIDPRYPTKTDTKRKTALDRQVATYIKGYAAHIAAGELREPSQGDCWGCLLAPKDTRAVRPNPHGRIEVMGIDHYLSHFEEKYYVPSLLANAIKARGYNDPGFIWHMITARKDGELAAGILRAYFRKLKPALLKLRAA